MKIKNKKIKLVGRYEKGMVATKKVWEVWKKHEWGGMILLLNLGDMGFLGGMTATILKHKLEKPYLFISDYIFVVISYSFRNNYFVICYYIKITHNLALLLKKTGLFLLSAFQNPWLSDFFTSLF